MRNLSDRAWLIVTYAVLVSVVVFLSWDVDQRLKQNREVLCDTAWSQAALSLGIFALATQDVEDPAAVEVINTQFALIDFLRGTCGPEPFDLEVSNG